MAALPPHHSREPRHSREGGNPPESPFGKGGRERSEQGDLHAVAVGIHTLRVGLGGELLLFKC